MNLKFCLVSQQWMKSFKLYIPFMVIFTKYSCFCVLSGTFTGDYIATMETKFNRQNKETNFVRVYINWDSIATMQQSKMTSSGVSLGSSECGMVQPMRARIAGRVTPTTNQSELGSLEMIEIPVKRNPNNIECCQVRIRRNFYENIVNRVSCCTGFRKFNHFIAKNNYIIRIPSSCTRYF